MISPLVRHRLRVWSNTVYNASNHVGSAGPSNTTHFSGGDSCGPDPGDGLAAANDESDDDEEVEEEEWEGEGGRRTEGKSPSIHTISSVSSTCPIKCS